MKKLIKQLITKLFFKYCFKETEMANWIVMYVVPKNLQDGKYMLTEIERITSDHLYNYRGTYQFTPTGIKEVNGEEYLIELNEMEHEN